MESLKSSKFKQLNSDELHQLTGGAIFPKSGSETVGDKVTNPSGQTYQNYSDWRTGWFSSQRSYGDAYQVKD